MGGDDAGHSGGTADDSTGLGGQAAVAYILLLYACGTIGRRELFRGLGRWGKITDIL